MDRPDARRRIRQTRRAALLALATSAACGSDPTSDEGGVSGGTGGGRDLATGGLPVTSPSPTGGLPVGSGGDTPTTSTGAVPSVSGGRGGVSNAGGTIPASGGTGGSPGETGGTGAAPSGGAGGRGGIEWIDDVPCAETTCLLVRTKTADYFLDKDGAGLASLVDRSGRDWVSWSRRSGHLGDFRGIPNLGPCCHPGYTGAHTSVVTETGERLVVRSAPEDDTWELQWEFFADHLSVRVVRAPSSYFLLYEGTPGGALGPEDRIGFADGRLLALDEAEFLGDLAGPEWVYFLDTEQNRAFVLLHPEDDDVPDVYWTFESMTVFGFGRTCRGACTGLTRDGDRLVLALTDETDAPSLTELVARLASF